VKVHWGYGVNLGGLQAQIQREAGDTVLGILGMAGLKNTGVSDGKRV
jgi:hypothetical protein